MVMSARFTNVRFYHARANKIIKQEMRRKLDAMGAFLKNRIRQNLNVPVVKTRRTRRRDTSRGLKGSTYKYVDPSSRSKPGEYPRKDTNALRRSIFAERISAFLLIVGTTERYGMALEVLMGRKLLVASLMESKRSLVKILKNA